MERKPQKIGLDNPVFRGRLRNPLTDKSSSAHTIRRPIVHTPSRIATQHSVPSGHATSLTEQQLIAKRVTANRIAAMAIKDISTGGKSIKTRIKQFAIRHKPAGTLRPKIALQAMAVLVFVVGVSVSLRTEYLNRQATAKVEALSQQADTSSDVGRGDMPSTKKPSPAAMGNYVVAPDLPRYISISKFGVKARVLQMGVKADGALDTPRNVYDAGWYTGSAKPGQQGATVIDGHVSSWKTKGVFYNLKNLHHGDKITITRGDGAILTYRVVRQQTYKAESVDMQKVITPVTQGKSGLNIITCAGKVKPGTNDFTHRIVVFAEQV